MRTFILRARKGSTRAEKLRKSIGSNEHFEIVLHTIINAFYISNNFRHDVEVYIVLDSAEDFPRTLKLSSGEGLSLKGFHEEAIFSVIEDVLKNSQSLQKNETLNLQPGISISGFGFEKLIETLIKIRPIFLLEPKGENIQNISLPADPVFILSDHLAMPKNSIQRFKRQGLKTLSLGKKMLFAAQCVVILNYELDK